MHSSVLFKTKSKVPYLHSAKINQFLLCHPALFFLLDLSNQKIDIKSWLENLKADFVEIDDYGPMSRDELYYYYQKYLLLSENEYFDEVDQTKKISGRLNPYTIKSTLANTLQLTFETTDRCNLKCKYCGYGEFYTDYDQRTNKDMDIAIAKNTVNYLLELWNSPLNQSHGKDIHVSFYGGEPLLNFPFIKELVSFLEGLTLKHNNFVYSMTTNGILLEKHIAFLVEKDFKLLISLDGDEQGNGYRVFPNGKPAYNSIYKNVQYVKANYPDYFERKVEFNCVLHSMNSISGIHKFFKTHFNKAPTINEVSGMGIDPKKINEFLKTYKNFNESLNQAENYSEIEKDMFIRLPDSKGAVETLFQYSGYVFKKYDELIFTRENESFIPTGTCLPFSRKIFITVNGKILPCERIGQQFSFGYVDNEKMEIDFNKVAEKFNEYYDKLSKQCNVCRNVLSCKQCMFYLDIESDNPVCIGLMNSKDFSDYLSARLSYLENNPDLYHKAMKEITIV